MEYEFEIYIFIWEFYCYKLQLDGLMTPPTPELFCWPYQSTYWGERVTLWQLLGNIQPSMVSTGFLLHSGWRGSAGANHIHQFTLTKSRIWCQRGVFRLQKRKSHPVSIWMGRQSDLGCQSEQRLTTSLKFKFESSRILNDGCQYL